jgi:hypothetical protein
MSALCRASPTVPIEASIPALRRCAVNAFPAWVSALQNVRHTVVFGASGLSVAAVAIV